MEEPFMFTCVQREFDQYFSQFVYDNKIDTRTLPIKYLRVLNPKAPDEEKKYEKRACLTGHLTEAFKTEAYFYFQDYFDNEQFQNYEVFYHQFSEEMMTLLCKWERDYQDLWPSKIRSGEIKEEQIVNDEWEEDGVIR